MSAWSWAGAKVQGTSHLKSGVRCQDAYKCFLAGDTLVVIVSDGAGSAQFGGEGASLVCRRIGQGAARYFRAGGSLPDEEEVLNWVNDTRDTISAVATKRGLPRREFAATLVCVLAGPNETLIVHVGDGVAGIQFAGLESWSSPLWPAHGEYAATTYFVTDDPAPMLRFHWAAMAASRVVAMSDGLERLALRFADREPHAPFFDMISQPLLKSAEMHRDATLSRQLAEYLNSEAINARTDDDKTLVVATRR